VEGCVPRAEREMGADSGGATRDTERSAALAQFAGVVADIARALESPRDADARLRHVLGMVRQLVPCDRCALYRRDTDGGGALLVVPDVPAHDRSRLAVFLGKTLTYLDGDESTPRPFDARIRAALPVIGADEILGVLLVDREHREEYEPHHLRLLSAVCSQLGAYLTMVRLHQDASRQTSLLVERERQLRDAGRFREEFIGVVGHDLRNPLSAIRTGAQLLMKRAGLDERDMGVAERVASSADRMSRMIDDLMDFARGRLGGGIPLRRRVVDLQVLCTDVVEEAQAAHNRTVGLNVTGDLRGYWDHDRLAQLLSNLVGNALEHSAGGAAASVTARDDGESAVVEVNNQGAPIPPAQIERIFDPFRRGDRSEGRGLGLGLYIVERIVHAHGGTIDVRSTEREGTTFSVRLPRRRASDRDGIDR
jgi:signal transduction histidine kinase